MRSICKKGSVTLVAVLALCVVASASASAAKWYVNGEALKTSATLSQTTKVEEKLELAFYAEEEHQQTITCTSLTGVAGKPFEIIAPSTLKIGDFLFKGCKIAYPAGCKIAGEEIGTSPVSANLLVGTGEEDHGEFALEKGKVWSEFGFSGCSLEGLGYTLEGTLPVKLPHGQDYNTEQELVFSKTPGLYNHNSSEPVYLTGKVKLKLTSGAKWSLF